MEKQFGGGFSCFIVQAYQGDKLVKEWKDVKSGTKLMLPGTGETEIKIWAGGKTPDDAIWIWVKDN